MRLTLPRGGDGMIRTLDIEGIGVGDSISTYTANGLDE
jgi:hypothetical protein